MMTENEEEFGGIFTDDESVKTLRESAKALGINPDLVAPEDGEVKVQHFARKNCKHCYGRGVIDICLSPSKFKWFWRNEGVKGRVSKRRRQRRGPSVQRRKVVTGVSPGNELHEQWNPDGHAGLLDPERDAKMKRLLGKTPVRGGIATSRPEPYGYKEDNMSQVFCRCIRTAEI